MNIYELKKINKEYINFNNKTLALNNINFSIKEGEIVVILGPSGSGKSTLLNVLSGIDNPTNGKIYFKENRIDNMNSLELTNYRKDNLGFIFQSYNLISNLTVIENIELGLNLSKNPMNMKKVIDIVGLNKHAHKYPYQLSGGQMQRVSIARALVKNPKVLFCDEPTGALDEKTGKKVLKALEEINNEYKTTMIIVTHNPSIVLMADTVIKMNSGKVVSITHNDTKISAIDLRWA